MQIYLRFYVEHGSAMHVAFLDASKAFDRVNRCKLLTKLENQGEAKYILRLISYDFISQHIYMVGEFLLGFFYIYEWSETGGVFSLRSFLMSTWTILSHSSIHNISAVALVTVFLNQGG